MELNERVSASGSRKSVQSKGEALTNSRASSAPRTNSVNDYYRSSIAGSQATATFISEQQPERRIMRYITGKNVYSNKTLVDNWFEQRYADDVAMARKLKSQSLLSGNVCKYFEQPIQSTTTASTDTHSRIYSTDCVMFKACGNLDRYESRQDLNSFLHLNYKAYKNLDEFTSSYPCWSSQCQRFDHSTVFKIEPSTKCGNSCVNYGENVHLTTLDGLYALYTDYESSSKSNKLNVRFARCASLRPYNFEWKLMPLTTARHLEYDGKPVDSRKAVYLQHVSTGTYLTVCEDKPIKCNGFIEHYYEVNSVGLVSRQQQKYHKNDNWLIVKPDLNPCDCQ